MKISIISSLAIIATISLSACGGANTGSDSQEATSSHGGEEITLEKYKSTIAEDKVTMVDFYTTWCGPCKRMAPDVVKLKKEYAGKANVLQVDAEGQMEIASMYQLQGYPTIMFFKKGNLLATELGGRSYDQLKAKIESLK